MRPDQRQAQTQKRAGLTGNACARRGGNCLWHVFGYRGGASPPQFFSSVVLHDFDFDAVAIVKVKPATGFIVIVLADLETFGLYFCRRRIKVVDHDCPMV